MKLLAWNWARGVGTVRFFIQRRRCFLWKRINGERTVGQLAQQLKEQFGDQAEPLYDRLVKYMQILHNNEFILFRGKDKVKE